MYFSFLIFANKNFTNVYIIFPIDWIHIPITLKNELFDKLFPLFGDDGGLEKVKTYHVGLAQADSILSTLEKMHDCAYTTIILKHFHSDCWF